MIFSLLPPTPGKTPSPHATILDLYSTPSIEARLIHLILGTTDFLHDHTTRRLKQKLNFAVLGAPEAQRGKRGLKRALASQSIDLKQLDLYLSSSLAQNSFFKEIFDEFGRFYYLTSLKLHTQAFLHLYRALERISYSFPVAYAIKSKDYKGTFTSFKAYVSAKDNTGELAFFNAFVKEIVDDSILYAVVKLDVTSNSASTRSANYSTLKKIFSDEMILSSVDNSYIEVQYRYLISGFIELRNRYFHFMSSNPRNLTGKDLMNPDEFFSIVNFSFANWLCYIYFRVLDARVA
jgi:hypothetical protein